MIIQSFPAKRARRRQQLTGEEEVTRLCLGYIINPWVGRAVGLGRVYMLDKTDKPFYHWVGSDHFK